MAMQPKTYAKGAMIYEEGDPSTCVYRIKSGEIEITKATERGNRVQLAVLHAGEIFGEMGVLQGLERSASARVVEPADVEVYDSDAFYQAVQNDGGFALSLLRILCRRLSQTNVRFASAVTMSGSARASDVEHLEISVTRGGVSSDQPPILIQTYDLPLTVGSARRPGNTHYLSLPHLEGGLAPDHFTIANQDGLIALRDEASLEGTRVNGRAIGPFEQSFVAPMQLGRNEIVVGKGTQAAKLVVVLKGEASEG